MSLSESRGANALGGILVHYFQVVARHTGDMHWDWENSGEIVDAVDQFADAIEGAIADEVERRLAEALARVGVEIKEG